MPSGMHKLLFGGDYRALWTTPATLEVLDLGTEAGGLTPVTRVGGMQTKALAFRGNDGRNCTFRSLEKDASEILEEDFRDTLVDEIVEDAQSAQHRRARSSCAACPRPRAFPARRGGWSCSPTIRRWVRSRRSSRGRWVTSPSTRVAATPSNPGFLGITEIIDHIELYRRLEAGEGDRADEQALLKARLVDLFVGDWDRHRKQWRWARFAGNPTCVPIPDDRDQAFSRYEGLLLDLNRPRDPRLQKTGVLSTTYFYRPNAKNLFRHRQFTDPPLARRVATSRWAGRRVAPVRRIASDQAECSTADTPPAERECDVLTGRQRARRRLHPTCPPPSDARPTWHISC